MNVVLGWLAVFVGGLAAGAFGATPTGGVVINGQRASDAQVAYIEQRACARIPNGNYWLNMQTGTWGYAGNPRVQGVLGEACEPRRDKSLSERRQLYRPGEILSQ